MDIHEREARCSPYKVANACIGAFEISERLLKFTELKGERDIASCSETKTEIVCINSTTFRQHQILKLFYFC